jgi:hypothetical protein
MVAVLAGAGAFVLFQVGLVLAAERSRAISDPYFADREERLTELERAAPGAPVVLVLGTSRTLGGFASGRVGPAATVAGTPAVAFNFGVPGAGPITQSVYLGRLLAGHAPSVLILEVLPSLFADLPDRPQEANLLLADRLTWAEIDLVTSRYAFPVESTRARRAAADRCPWDAHRFKIMSRLEPEAIPGESRLNSGRSADAHGWHPSMAPAPDRKAFERIAPPYRAALHDWKPGPAPTLALRDAITMCRERGITVALLIMPESSEFRALYSPPVRESVNAFLAGVCAEFDCPLIDAREWTPDDGFVDGHHLLRPAALTFTDRLTTEAILPLLQKRRAP